MLTNKILHLSKPAARRLILAYQGLYPPRELKGKQGALTFMERVRSIQFDPINVVGRNPDLVMQSRVRDFRPFMLDQLLYQDRTLVDNWDKMASLSLTDDWPYFSHHRNRMRDIFGVPTEVVMSHAQNVLEKIKKQGPQSSLEFKGDEKTDWAWGPTRVSRATLEGLFKMGQLGVHHRINNRRYFDLIDNLLPSKLIKQPDPNQSLEEYQIWHVIRRIRSLGLAHPNAGEQWGGMIGVKAPQRRDIIQRSVENQDLIAVEVEELPGDVFYIHPDDLSLMDQIQGERSQIEAAFIAPLDNLLWDRKTLTRLFNFNYMWEVYKPKKQREYGYYVLPVLCGDRFIARFDPEFDKKTRVFTVRNWWWEEDLNPDPSMVEALVRCMKDFLVYLDAVELKYSKKLLQKGNLDWLEEL